MQEGSLDIRRYEYDPLGRQTSWSQNLETQRTVRYTPFDLPRSITTTQPTTRTVNYAYDADQHKFSESDGSATTTYIDDLYERRVDNATGVTKHIFYVFADGKRIAQVVQNGATETTTRLYSDLAGSVTGADQGEPGSRQAFSPWGERLPLSTTSPASPMLNVTTGFTDQEHDDSVGLINMRGRVYDPVTRTFLTPDPIVGTRKIGGWNKYSYVLNNPLKFTDPSGFDGVESIKESDDSQGGEVITFNDELIQSQVMSIAPPNSGTFRPGESTDATQAPAGIAQDGSGGTGPDLGFVRDAIDRLNNEAPLEHPLDQRLYDIPIPQPTPTPALALSSGGEEGTGPNGPQQHDAPKYLGTIEANERSSVAAPPEEDLLAIAAEEAQVTSTAIVPYYPAANGFLDATATTLQRGQLFDRIGGSDVSRFFSPVGTPLAARALPPGTTGALRTFEVLKPFGAQSGIVAPAFGQLGLGVQIRTSLTLGELLEGGFLREVTP